MAGKRKGLYLKWAGGAVLAVIGAALLLWPAKCFPNKGQGADKSQGEAYKGQGADKSQGEAYKGQDTGDFYGADDPGVLKNDGRYLYQMCNGNGRFLQITDTKDGLKAVSFLQEEGEEVFRDFYVWEDTLALIIQDTAVSMPRSMEAQEKACYRVRAYDIEDRSRPREVHTFTLKGHYKGSRFSDGYLYLIGEVPASYFVMASIDLGHLGQFTDVETVAVSGKDGCADYYIGSESIYIMDGDWLIDDRKEANQNDLLSEWEQYSNKTDIYRFSYGKGKIEKEAEGKVRGILTPYGVIEQGGYSVSEHNGYLRIVTDVRAKKVRKERNPQPGIFAGSFHGQEAKKPHKGKRVEIYEGCCLYVLDADLRVVGRIEDLSRADSVDKMIFLGDLGVWINPGDMAPSVPLAFFDLSHPWNPKALGGVEIQGDGNYIDCLQVCGDGLALGISSEKVPETEGKERWKVFLLDVSEPADIKEVSELLLDDEYWYSAEIASHRLPVLDRDGNLYGFSIEGSKKISYQLFSLGEGRLKEEGCLLCAEGSQDDDFYEMYEVFGIQGAYIDGRFFLSYCTGQVEEYDLTDRRKVDELSMPDWQK